MLRGELPQQIHGGAHRRTLERSQAPAPLRRWDQDIQFIRTEAQFSDMMTKSLGRVRLQELRQHIGMVKVTEV
jgi:hypothetical protein